MTQRRLAVITGASAGIGEAFAHLLAPKGFDLLLVARRDDRLTALAGALPGAHTVLKADLADPAAGEAVEAAVGDLGRPLDVLINNAGFGVAGPVLEADAAALTAMVDVNVRALVDLSRRFLPAMVARGTGGIINVASTAAFQPGPNMAGYYATKAFVLSFSEALFEECKGTGVVVSALCPGPTHSEFGEVSGMNTHRLFQRAHRMSAEDVAKIGWKGFEAGRRVVITGQQNRMTATAGRLMPHRLLLPVVRYLQTEP
ncbi:MAG: SDR family oxidoreductase [Devosia sp.]